MRRWLLALCSALVVAGWLSAGAERAAAGGATFVAAPDELGERACRQGERARTVGFGSNVAVIGCAGLKRAEVLLAADRRRGTACTWVVAEGGENYEDCAELHPTGSGSPLGGRDVRATYTRATRGLGDPYLIGLAAPGVARAHLRYRARHGGLREARVDLLEVDPELGPQVGAPGRFSYMLAVVPADADTCRGMTLEGRDGDGDLVGIDRLSRGSPPAVAVTLPGSNRCESPGTAGARLDAAGAALAFSAAP